MTEDAELLRRFAQDRSQAAFAELVQRRIDFVYAVALRHVGGDAHLAEDVTQSVFVDLARKAPELSRRVALSGWLYRSAQFAAADVVRAERRRRAREQASFVMNQSAASSEGNLDVEKLRPVLDQVLEELNEEDRDAVALRFFEQRSFSDVARALQISEEAARKRVSRALDQLHGFLARRGVTSTTAALGLALADQAAVAAPAGLARAIATAAAGNATLAGGAGVAAGSALGFFSGAKIAAIAGGIALAAGLFFVARAEAARVGATELAATAARRDAWQSRIAGAEIRLAAAEERIQVADRESGRLLQEIRELLPAVSLPPGEAAGVAFVIDTSGSMRDPATGKLWPAVWRSVQRALDAFPEARYFLLVDADGRNVSGAQNQWLARAPAALQQGEQALGDYPVFSESNPVPGISQILGALPSRGKEAPPLHVCVIGDEFTGPIARFLSRLDQLNPADAKGIRRATISAIQLPTTRDAAGQMGNTGVQFEAAMREAAKGHGGSFTLLPDNAFR